TTSDQVVEVIVGSPGNDTPSWVDELVRESALPTAVPRHLLRIAPVGARRYYAVKNTLAEHARGEIIAFCDADILPQPGWLTALIAPFRHPTVAVVGSAPVVGPLDSRYSRAVAATSIFDPNRRHGTEPTSHFFANAVAFRRGVFAANRFPDNTRESRGAEVVLANRLMARGLTIVRSNDAVVMHPAPAGFRAFTAWHLVNGQDSAH